MLIRRLVENNCGHNTIGSRALTISLPKARTQLSLVPVSYFMRLKFLPQNPSPEQNPMPFIMSSSQCISDLSNSQFMTLDHTFHHHTACVNALAANSDGEKLLSGGDDADIVVWDILTGEKVQVIRCAFHGAIGALAWIPQKPGLALGFAFGCADGSIHLYQRAESSTIYQYLTQEQVHDGPVLDLKYDEHFGRLANWSACSPSRLSAPSFAARSSDFHHIFVIFRHKPFVDHAYLGIC